MIFVVERYHDNDSGIFTTLEAAVKCAMSPSSGSDEILEMELIGDEYVLVHMYSTDGTPSDNAEWIAYRRAAVLPEPGGSMTEQSELCTPCEMERTPEQKINLLESFVKSRVAAHARSTDPQTSHDAAARISNFTNVAMGILETLIEYGPMHDEKLIAKFREYCPSVKASDSGIRSRRAELVGYGELRDSGDRAKTKSGRDSIVWEIVR